MLYPQGVWRVLGLLLIVPLWILACGTDATATPEPATPSPGQIIEQSGVKMAALQSAIFTLESDGKTSAKFFGVELNFMEGQVDMPERFKVRVEATTTFPRTFIELNVVGVGDRIFISDPIKKGTWIPVPSENLPFKFADLGRTLGGIIQAIEAPTIIGTESVDGNATWRIQGSVPSERLRALVTNAEPGHEVGLDR